MCNTLLYDMCVMYLSMDHQKAMELTKNESEILREREIDIEIETEREVQTTGGYRFRYFVLR